MTEKQEYVVKPGFSHGIGRRYKPGDTVMLTKEEATPFLDKLALVTNGAVQLSLSDAPVVETVSPPAEVSEENSFGAFHVAVRTRLQMGGLDTIEKVQAATDEELLAIKGIAKGRLVGIREIAPHVNA